MLITCQWCQHCTDCRGNGNKHEQ